MKKQLKDRWLKRLRDPKMRKCKFAYVDKLNLENVLKDNDIDTKDIGTCCVIGHFFVANRQAISNSIKAYCKKRKYNGVYLEYNWSRTFIPQELHINVAGMNDGTDKSLPEIADWIDANVQVTE